jgi:hypothetical protein
MIIATVAPTQSATFILDDSGDLDAQGNPNVETASYFNDGYTYGFSGLSPSRIYCEFGAGSNLQILGSGNSMNSLTATFPGDFNQNWTVSGFSTSAGFTVPGNFSGSLLASGLGTATTPIQQIQIGGTMAAGAKIKVNYLSSLSVAGDLAGTVNGYGNSGSQSQPTIGPVTIGGNFSGTITAPIIQSINMQPASNFSGHASETEPGADFQSLVLGTVTSTGVINAGAIANATIAGDMAGQITVSGPLNTMTVGGNLTGTVSAATIGTVTVAGTLTGQVTASQSVGSVTAGGQPVAQGIFLLDPSISAALNVAGNAHITIPGSIFVDSTSPTAVTAAGSAQVTATGIQVVGGVQQSGSATLSPTPTTGLGSFNDPMAFLSGPSTAGLTNYGSVSYSSGSHALQPGIYSQIKASGNASLSLNPGIYIIEGGGVSVTGTASITGAGVTIYNTGSNYPNPGGSYGGITLSGNGSFNLTPAATTAGGAYPGIVIYQSRANTRALALSGNAGAGLTGMVYAPSAPVVIGGNATLNAALVADRLQVSGNGSSTQVAAGSTGDNSASPDTLLAGDLEVYVNDPNGYFTPNELARIQDAIANWDALLAPYNVQITEVSDPSLANVVIDDGATSAAGSAADGILGCYNGSNNEITLLQGWNWYDGSDPTQIGSNQYDFQTVVTHELGHALGLGGSADPTSPMYETLAGGVVHRTPTVADLNISDPPAGADPERAAPPPLSSGAADLVVAWNRAQQPGSAAGNAALEPIGRLSRQERGSLIFSGLPALAAQTATSFVEQGGSGWETEVPFGAGLQELSPLPWDVQDQAPSAPAEWLRVATELSHGEIGNGAETTGLRADLFGSANHRPPLGLGMQAKLREEAAAMPTGPETVSLEGRGEHHPGWRPSSQRPGEVALRLQLIDWFFVAVGAAALTALRRESQEPLPSCHSRAIPQ